jgi:NAD(P)-dependent dehydrogenase (short-subunit alcohol dehydrogenase family)
MDLDLNGRVAIVTGGSRGIGKATARELVREGANVAIVARGHQGLIGAAADLEAETQRPVLSIVCDTTSAEAVHEMVSSVVQQLGGVDILVNCAARPGGRGPEQRLSDLDPDSLWPDFNDKVLGYLRCIREVVPHMLEKGTGRIINVSGLAARSTGSVAASIRNVAVAAITKNLADELGAFGISVVVVHPGVTRTEATPDWMASVAAERGEPLATIEQQLAGENVLRRMIDAREVAQVITFLASSKAIAINGDAVVVGGGIPGPIHY